MILAIDTATRWTGLALYDGTAVLMEAGWYSTNTQTMELAPSIDSLLHRVGLQASGLKAIAVALGPGSYTGLRVGLALAKGIALAHQTPLIGVPTLDIVAHGVGQRDGRLLIACEAGRTRVCTAVYTWHKHAWQAQSAPIVTTWETLLPTLDGPHTFIGEITAEAARLIRTTHKAFHLASPTLSTRRAACLAEIGWTRLRQGKTDDPQTVAPIYLHDPAGAVNRKP